MQDKIAILIPTRERPDDLKLFAESWQKYSEGLSDVIIGIDEDDPTDYSFLSEYPFKIVKTVKKPFLYLLNELAVEASKEYKYVGFMEDDCCFTQLWESQFIEKLNEISSQKQYAIVWGNDNINKDSIVGLPFMTSNIVQKLGYMSPPEIKFLFGDHYWKHLGGALDCLYYFPDILIEHRHFSTGKRPKCKISNEIENGCVNDPQGFHNYINGNFRRDLQKLAE